MTNWKINLTDTEYATFARTEQQTLIRPRFDVQRGDGAAIYRDGTWMAGLEVIHVAQNVPGVEAGHLVITFRNRRLEAAERAADARLEHVGTLRLIHSRRVLTLRRQRPHGVQFANVYRWGRPRRKTNEFPQTPWPHLRIERDLEMDYVEIYWPGIGGITASRLHYTSLLPDGRGHYLRLRDRWIKQGRGEM